MENEKLKEKGERKINTKTRNITNGHDTNHRTNPRKKPPNRCSNPRATAEQENTLASTNRLNLSITQAISVWMSDFSSLNS